MRRSIWAAADLRLHCQRLDLDRDDREAFACFAPTCRFDRRIDREHVDLARDPADQAYDASYLIGGVGEACRSAGVDLDLFHRRAQRALHLGDPRLDVPNLVGERYARTRQIANALRALARGCRHHQRLPAVQRGALGDAGRGFLYLLGRRDELLPEHPHILLEARECLGEGLAPLERAPGLGAFLETETALPFGGDLEKRLAWEQAHIAAVMGQDDALAAAGFAKGRDQPFDRGMDIDRGARPDQVGQRPAAPRICKQGMAERAEEEIPHDDLVHRAERPPFAVDDCEEADMVKAPEGFDRILERRIDGDRIGPFHAVEGG